MKTEYTTRHLHMPTAKAINKCLGITPEQLVEWSKAPDRVIARYLYSRIRFYFAKRSAKEIGIELCRHRTSILISLKTHSDEKTDELYNQITASLSRKINDLPLKQPSEDVIELAEQLQGATQPTISCYTFNKGCQYYSAHNFKFNASEEEAIERACQEAEEFMKSYGKGDLLVPMVDCSHYANSFNLWL